MFWLDSDEYLSEELIKEIKQIITIGHSEQSEESSEACNGYLIPRQNYIFGKWIAYTGWYPDYQLRLFKNGKAKLILRETDESMQ